MRSTSLDGHMSTVVAGSERSRSRRVRRVRTARPGEVLIGVAVVVVSLAVLVPLVLVAVQVARETQDMETVKRLLSRPAFRRVMLDTALLVAFATPVGTLLGVVLAVLLERTDVPVAGRLGQVLPMMSFLMPPLIGAIGWTLLFSPDLGLANALLDDLGLPKFSIYTYPGVLVAGTIYLVPYSYALCSAALKNISSEKEEAARMSGASTARTLFTITIPLIKPALTGSALLVAMMALGEFSVPLLLGNRWGFTTLTVQIYNAVHGGYPPDYLTAAVLSSFLLTAALICIWLQRRLLRKGGFETLTGKGSRTMRIQLGVWRYPLAVAIWLYLGLALVFPVIALAYVSLMTVWRPGYPLHELTLGNYRRILDSEPMMASLANSLQLALVAATVALVIGALIGYLMTKLDAPRIGTLADYSATLPLGIPHLVIVLGILLAVTQFFPTFYGSRTVLVVAYVILLLPFAVRGAVGPLRQMSSELQDAAHMSGASLFRSLRTVTLPLLMASLTPVWLLVFMIAFRELPASAVLASAKSPVVSRQMLDLYDYGYYPALTAFALLIMVVNAAVVGLTLVRWRQVLRRLRAFVNRTPVASLRDETSAEQSAPLESTADASLGAATVGSIRGGPSRPGRRDRSRT